MRGRIGSRSGASGTHRARQLAKALAGVALAALVVSGIPPPAGQAFPDSQLDPGKSAMGQAVSHDLAAGANWRSGGL